MWLNFDILMQFFNTPNTWFGVQGVWRQSRKEVICHKGFLWQGRQYVTFMCFLYLNLCNSFLHIFLPTRVVYFWSTKDCWVPQCEDEACFVLIRPHQTKPSPTVMAKAARIFQRVTWSHCEASQICLTTLSPTCRPHLNLWSSPPRNPN